MDFLQQIKQMFRSGDIISRLIILNAGIFVITAAVRIVLTLFNIDFPMFTELFAVPAHLGNLIFVPWTVISYMFYHEQIFHILFNMFALFWFSKIFLIYFNEKQLMALYILGGISGALLYIASYNIFPYFNQMIFGSRLLGASGSVMAIIVASAVQSPKLELRFLLLGSVKLQYIAIAVVLISFLGITSSNAGGEIAHLGGALFGYLFVVSLRGGKDITAWLNKSIDAVLGIFKPQKMKIRPNKSNVKMTDADFNVNKKKQEADIDRILDKIKKSGYESLSADEKNRLFNKNN